MKESKVIAVLLVGSLLPITLGLIILTFMIKVPKEEQEKIDARRYTVYQGELTFKNLKNVYSHDECSWLTTEDGRSIKFIGAHIKEEQKND